MRLFAFGLFALLAASPASAQGFNDDLVDRPRILIENPTWEHVPSSREFADLAQAIPPRAHVMLTCDVRLDGSLTDCTASEETPARAGVGLAALSLARSFKMKPQRTTMVTVRFPINFVDPGPRRR